MFDSGNTGFMLVCAMLVLLMTPGLAFFYGGLSRRKNVVNTMIMVFGVLGIVAITWTIFGWSFAYGGDGSIPFFGGFDQIGLTGLVANITGEAPEAAESRLLPRDGGCRLPAGILHDHHGDYHRFSCGPYEVWCDLRVRCHLDHRGVSAAGAHGLGR